MGGRYSVWFDSVRVRAVPSWSRRRRRARQHARGARVPVLRKRRRRRVRAGVRLVAAIEHVAQLLRRRARRWQASRLYARRPRQLVSKMVKDHGCALPSRSQGRCALDAQSSTSVCSRTTAVRLLSKLQFCVRILAVALLPYLRAVLPVQRWNKLR